MKNDEKIHICVLMNSGVKKALVITTVDDCVEVCND